MKLLILMPSVNADTVLAGAHPGHLLPTVFVAVWIYGDETDGELRPDESIADAIECHQPDVVCYVGAPAGSQVPNTETLLAIRERCRLVHWCCDASSPGWLPRLTEYKIARVFHRTINIDGVDNWPKSEDDVTTLFPLDLDWFREPQQRVRKLGFAGAMADKGPRRATLDALGERVTLRLRNAVDAPYQDCARFLLGCRATVNDARTDGIGERMHVKARVVEAGAAGCMLFENRGSPVRQWLTPGVHYLGYDDPEDIITELNDPCFDQRAESYGVRLREWVRGQDFHGRFWKAVMG